MSIDWCEQAACPASECVECRQTRRAALTAQRLYERLATIPQGERETTEMRIVFHGYEQASFNLPALGIADPSFSTGNAMLVICAEERS